MGKIVAVTGMSGSGKTTFCANLACVLAEVDKVTIILPAELNYGNIQTFFGAAVENTKGVLCSLSDKTEQPEKFLTQCNKVNENIYLMSVPNDNTELHSGEIEENRLEQILRKLSMIADYLIIDCNSDLYNGISIMGIEKADMVYCLNKATAQTAAWRKVYIPLISQLTDGEICDIITEHQIGCIPAALVKTADITVCAYLPEIELAPILENSGSPICLDKNKMSQRYKQILKNLVEQLEGRRELE